MSNAHGALAERAPHVESAALRQQVAQSAKRFKSTWIELARLLVRVYDEGLHEPWGFESFDAYCTKELHIRKSTAQKLLLSVRFLGKHEPKVLEEQEMAERAPAFEVVQVLAGAEERGQLDAQEYRSIRDTIWSPERPVAELRRELSERFPAPEREVSEAAQFKRLAGWARKLAEELGRNRSVPRAVAERAGALAEDLAELVGRD